MTTPITYKGPYSITNKGLRLGCSDRVYEYYNYGNAIRFLKNGLIHEIKLNGQPYVIDGNTLVISDGFDDDDLLDEIMRDITILIFDEEQDDEFACFNRELNLTPYITSVAFGVHFDRYIKLPSSIRSLTFGRCFDRSIDLPRHIKILRFGDCFNQRIIIQPYLKVLTFGCDFNKPISLNKNLHSLTFDDDFNQLIVLNKYLSNVKFGLNFRQPFVITKNLTLLSLGKYNILQRDTLNVTNIVLRGNNWIVDNLSNSIQYIELGRDFVMSANNLPNCVDASNPQYKIRCMRTRIIKRKN